MTELLGFYQTWPLWRKHLVNFTVSLFVFLSNYITNSISPILVPIAIDLNISLTQASYLLTLNLLFLGLGNLFWVPLALKIGKRPVWVMCAIIFFASSIWSAVANDFGSLLGARIVQGFGASAAEALGPTVVGDLFFVHERGMWMGLYVWVFSTGSGISGTFAGLLYNSNPDWHWVFWVNVILVGVLLVFVILFAAETNFIRPEETEGGEGMDPSQLEEIRAQGQTNWIASLSLFGWYDRLVHSPIKLTSHGHTAQRAHRSQSLLWLLWRPFLTLQYPAVVWGSLLYGACLGALILQLTANATAFPILYGFSPLATGNINISVRIMLYIRALLCS